ncbi:MAG TPA: hypothetical protein DDX98_03865 [Bacteroidales bacterium]|jgi:hypothetical protein|nr:hypothetical protein [Bacteroidales bacterium]
MKNLFYFCFVFAVSLLSCTKDQEKDIPHVKEEITIYNKTGTAKAYCSYPTDDESIIYLWNGTPVAYLMSGNNEIYGFNGKHIGWQHEGIYYNLTGKRTGFEQDALPGVETLPEPAKEIKEVMPVKEIRQFPFAQHIYSVDWSEESIEDWLLSGRA